jgi:molybdate transport system ATP-binding protein
MNRLVARFDVTYPDFRLQVDLDVPATGVTAVFGPSGAGKTTLLRCLSGLERSPNGFMRLGDQVWQDESQGVYVPIARRSVGYVFQEPRLFPHLKVRSNLQYGLKRTPTADRRLTLERVADILGINHLLDRRPGTLSGGEKQRVAIGRALLTSPRLLLLDEPLAGLDLARKREILSFITRVHRELAIPIMYVSHAVSEILQLADRVVLLKEGRIVMVGTVNDMLSSVHLSEMSGARQLGAVIETRVASHEPEFGLTRLAFSHQSLYVPLQALEIGAPLRVHVHARDVALALGPPATPISVLNVLEATVAEVRDGQGASADITLDVGCVLVARITRKSLTTLNLQSGQRVWAYIKTVALSEDLTD